MLVQADAIETRSVRLLYDPVRPGQPIRFVNQHTQVGFDLSASVPRLGFAEGEIGEARLLPDHISREDAPGESQLLLDYPASAVSDTRVEVRVVYSMPRDRNLVRKHAEVTSTGGSAPGLTLKTVKLLDEPVPDQVVFTMSGWQSYPVFTEQFFFGVEFPVA